MLRQRAEAYVGSVGLIDRRLLISSHDHAAISGLASKGRNLLGTVCCQEFLSADVRTHVFCLLRRSSVRSLAAALAGGAEIIFTPKPASPSTNKMRRIVQQLEASFLCGQTHAIVAMTDGVRADVSGDRGHAVKLRKSLEHHFESCKGPNRTVSVRDSVLGHFKRRATPSAADQLSGGQLANAVWCAIIHKPPKTGVFVTRCGRIQACPFDDHQLVDVTGVSDVSLPSTQDNGCIDYSKFTVLNLRKAHHEHPAP